jgi:rhodanese-related sulfurtransferase
MTLVQREGYKILDVRSAKDYDDKHITKPARSSLNAPVVLNDSATPNPRFLAEVRAQRRPASVAVAPALRHV